MVRPRVKTGEACPACGSTLEGNLIPVERREEFGGRMYFSRMISCQQPGVFGGGTLYWLCPDCDHAWHAWEDEEIQAIAQPFIDQANEEAAVSL